MKFLALIALTIAVYGTVEARPQLKLNLNTIFDGLVKDLQANPGDLDPLNLPDVTENLANIGSLELTNLQIRNIEFITRQGDIAIDLEGSSGDATADVTFDRPLKLDTDIKISIIGLGPSGHITGTVNELEAKLDALVNMADTQAISVELEEFAIEAKSIDIDLTGLGDVAEDLIEVVSTAASELLRKQVDEVVSNIVKDLANEQLKGKTFNINDLTG